MLDADAVQLEIPLLKSGLVINCPSKNISFKDKDEKKWVLFVSGTKANINGGVGVCYYIGDLKVNQEGRIYFKCEVDQAKNLDYGND